MLYGYGRIFGVAGMPALQEQKIACFDFCNKLDGEWGGFQSDDVEIRTLPFYKRQHGAEFLAMNVEGIIVARFGAAWNTPRHFHDTALRCIKRGVRLYILDIGEGEVTGSAMLMGMAKVLAAKNPFLREVYAESDWIPNGNVPLGWKQVRTERDNGAQWKLVPDPKTRKLALDAYAYYIQGVAAAHIGTKLRRAHGRAFPGMGFSQNWCDAAFRAVVCGFPIETHKVTEAFSGFSFRAWRLRDPAALALLAGICDTFQQERARLLESSALAQQLRPQLEPLALAEPVPLKKT